MGSSTDSTQVEVSVEESGEGLLLESLKSCNNSNLRGLKTVVLDLSWESKDILTKVISIDLKAIVSLDLSHCNLDYLPDPLTTLQLLKRLNLSYNKLEYVPDCLGNGLRSLENLDLSNNKLKSFEMEPKCVIKLRVLHLNNNKLINLPRWILDVNCFNLEELYYSNNETCSLKKSRFDCVGTYRLKKIELKNCFLRTADLKVLKNIRTLTYLDLSNEGDINSNCFIGDNIFANFFENVIWNDRLTVLCLNGLQTSSLPEEIANLIVLEELYLSQNDLLWLPNSLKSMETLRILDISHNQIISLPEGINKLNNLEILLAPYNSIASLPDFSVSKLRVLDLYNNYLEFDGIDGIKMNNINEIDLEQNFSYACALNMQFYEEKKNAFRMRSYESRFDGPKHNHYDDDESVSGDTSTDSEWNSIVESSPKKLIEDEENWSPKTCDNGCTSSDNEWTGCDKIYVRKKVKRALETPEWMFDDD